MVKVGRFAFIVGLISTAGAAGCFLAQPEATGASEDEVNESAGDVSQVLKSTVVLSNGCFATKVGPKHLLVAARCVAGKEGFTDGKTFTYRTVAQFNAGTGATTTAGEPSDAGATDSGSDAAASAAAMVSGRKAKIADIAINASYTAKCKAAGSCGLGSVEASDAKDIAVITVGADDLDGLTALPVDLDAVGQSDPVLSVTSGCDSLSGKATKIKTTRTIAVPAKSVNHAGSAYLDNAALVTRLGGAYVVTPGAAWSGSTDTHFCSSDLGAPLFRAGQAAVVGVASNFTKFAEGSKLPATLHHTRVDTASKVGTWLKGLGVETTSTCSESAEKCPERGFDGGVARAKSSEESFAPGSTSPGTSDAGGTDASTPLPPDAGKKKDDESPATSFPDKGDTQDIQEEPEAERLEPNEGDGGTSRRKKKTTGGCSAAPGTSTSGSSMMLGLGIAVGLVAARRRRQA